MAGLVAVMLAAVALGCAVTAMRAPSRTATVLQEAADTHREVAVAVRADGPGRRVAEGFDGSERWSWKGTIVGVGAGTDGGGGAEDGKPTLSVPVTVFAGTRPSSSGDGDRSVDERVEDDAIVPSFGAVVALTGVLRANEPGESTTFRLATSDPPRPVSSAPVWLAWTQPVRSAFAHAAAAMPGDGGLLLPGLAIGDESSLPSDLDEAMKASSLSHLTAVSGANCALVTGLLFFVAARLGAGRRLRIVVAALGLLAFVVLVGPGASILRAAVMATVVLVALARGRPADGLPSLALAVVVLLVHDPWLAWDYGFALSVFATAGLLLLAGPLARVLARWMPRALALVIAIPVAAQLACQPVLILLSPTLPLYGIGANLLAEPAAPLATVLGCLACLTLPWAPGVGQLFVQLAWVPSSWIAAIARTSAALPAAALPWPDGAPGVVLCVLAVVLVALLAGRARLPRLVGSVAAGGLLIGVTTYGGALGGSVVAEALARPPDWQVAACDVGQGDALLIRAAGEVGMIDVGREPDAAAACLARLGVQRVDLLVLTHYDADHSGGLAGVVDRVGRALVGAPDREADERVLARLTDRGVPVEQARRGQRGALGALNWEVLWPPGPPGPVPTGNDGSVVIRSGGAGLTSVFLGDLGEEAQDELLGRGDLGPVDVVKVAHHGSADQSAALYDTLAARIGLVSVGKDNGYGHPTRRALDILTGAGTVAARTDLQGLLLVSPGPDRPRLWAERSADADAGGRPYPGRERGGTWRPETPAEAARAVPGRASPEQRPARSRSSRGTRSARRRWCWCRGRRASSPIEPSAHSATRSRRRIRAWRSATSRRRTTRPASCSRSRAPPCSGSRASSASTPSRSAPTRS